LSDRVSLAATPRRGGSLWTIAFSATFKGTNCTPGIAMRDVQRGTIAAPSRAETRLTIVCFSSATSAILGGDLSGLTKDTISMPWYSTAEIDVLGDDPGPTLFHCHHEDHMDEGFASS